MNCSDTDLACHSMETDIPPDDLCNQNPDVCVEASQPEESLSMMDVQLDEPIFISLPSNLDVGTYDSLNGIQQMLDTCTPKTKRCATFRNPWVEVRLVLRTPFVSIRMIHPLVRRWPR